MYLKRNYILDTHYKPKVLEKKNMSNHSTTLLLISLMVFGIECRCGERLERALDLMQQRGNSARRRYDSEDADTIYRQRLHSAPIDVSVMKVAVEVYYIS